MISQDQLEEILRKQTQSQPYMRFGEVATGLGYLSRAQIERLLDIQDENRLRIGEILVLQSRMTEQELIDHAREDLIGWWLQLKLQWAIRDHAATR